MVASWLHSILAFNFASIVWTSIVLVIWKAWQTLSKKEFPVIVTCEDDYFSHLQKSQKSRNRRFPSIKLCEISFVHLLMNTVLSTFEHVYFSLIPSCMPDVRALGGELLIPAMGLLMPFLQAGTHTFVDIAAVDSQSHHILSCHFLPSNHAWQ